jgi:hypothetical protein
MTGGGLLNTSGGAVGSVWLCARFWLDSLSWLDPAIVFFSFSCLVSPVFFLVRFEDTKISRFCNCAITDAKVAV